MNAVNFGFSAALLALMTLGATTAQVSTAQDSNRQTTGKSKQRPPVSQAIVTSDETGNIRQVVGKQPESPARRSGRGILGSLFGERSGSQDQSSSSQNGASSNGLLGRIGGSSGISDSESDEGRRVIEPAPQTTTPDWTGIPYHDPRPAPTAKFSRPITDPNDPSNKNRALATSQPQTSQQSAGTTKPSVPVPPAAVPRKSTAAVQSETGPAPRVASRAATVTPRSDDKTVGSSLPNASSRAQTFAAPDADLQTSTFQPLSDTDSSRRPRRRAISPLDVESTIVAQKPERSSSAFSGATARADVELATPSVSPHVEQLEQPMVSRKPLPTTERVPVLPAATGRRTPLPNTPPSLAADAITQAPPAPSDPAALMPQPLPNVPTKPLATEPEVFAQGSSASGTWQPARDDQFNNPAIPTHPDGFTIPTVNKQETSANQTSSVATNLSTPSPLVESPRGTWSPVQTIENKVTNSNSPTIGSSATAADSLAAPVNSSATTTGSLAAPLTGSATASSLSTPQPELRGVNQANGTPSNSPQAIVQSPSELSNSGNQTGDTSSNNFASNYGTSNNVTQNNNIAGRVVENNAGNIANSDIDLPGSSSFAPISSTITPGINSPGPVSESTNDSSLSTSQVPTLPQPQSSTPSEKNSDLGVRAGVAQSTGDSAPANTIAVNAEANNVVGEIPGLRVITVGPAEIPVRHATTYKIFIENTGAINAPGAIVQVKLPVWVTIEGNRSTRGEISREDEPSTRNILWVVEGLPSGTREELAITLNATEAREFDVDTEWAVLPQSSIAHVVVREPMLEVLIEGPDHVIYGESETYKVRVVNPGTGTANAVLFTLSPNSATPQTQRIGVIPPGEEAQFEVELTAREMENLQIHGLAAGDMNLKAENIKDIQVIKAELEAVLDGPTIKYQDAEATYNIELSNVGLAACNAVDATLELPAGVSYVSGIDGAVVSKNRLSWKIAELPAGASSTFTFTCKMRQTGKQVFDFKCAGSALGSTRVDFETQVDALADLVLTINDPPAPAPVGKEVVYEIIVRNRGSKVAEQVNVLAQFGVDIEPIRIEGGDGEILPGQVKFATIAKIEAGQQVVMKVFAKAEREGHHRFCTEVSCGDTLLISEEATRYLEMVGQRVSRRSGDTNQQ